MWHANVAAVSGPQFSGRYATSSTKILRSGERSYGLRRNRRFFAAKVCEEA